MPRYYQGDRQSMQSPSATRMEGVPDAWRRRRRTKRTRQWGLGAW
ncbi:MAG: hypothetical protein ABJH07_09295 [Sedimentitalea sp.]